MPAPKGLTKQLPLRMTDEERALIESVQTLYGAHGVTLSLNDVVRHLIRRAAVIVAHTPAESLLQLLEHCKGCEHCEAETGSYKCADGLFLSRTYRRVLRAHGGAKGADGL
jgi:hypothetical protein